MVGYEDGNACEPDANGCSVGARFESVSVKRLGYRKVKIEFQMDERYSNVHGPHHRWYIRKLASLLGVHGAYVRAMLELREWGKRAVGSWR